MLEKLDKLYLKDDTHSAYEAYERFKTVSKVPSMTVSDNIIEFEHLYNKAKQHKMELPNGVVACCFLNGANISSHHKQLVKATLPELSYQSMKGQLKKIFSDPTHLVSDAKQEQAIKVEPAMELKVFMIVLAMLNSIDTKVVEVVELVEEEALVDQIKL